MDTNPELLAANSILKRGVRYQLPAPLWLRFFGIKHLPITITQFCRGTDLRVCALLMENGITEKLMEEIDPYAFMAKYYRVVLRAVALATLNRQRNCGPRIYLRESALRRITAWRLFELYQTALQYSGSKSFMTITRLMLATRPTKPNLGRMEGS